MYFFVLLFSFSYYIGIGIFQLEFIIRAEISLFIFPALRESGVHAKKI